MNNFYSVAIIFILFWMILLSVKSIYECHETLLIIIYVCGPDKNLLILIIYILFSKHKRLIDYETINHNDNRKDGRSILNRDKNAKLN